jgi:molybdate transport system ATP-binding protein
MQGQSTPLVKLDDVSVRSAGKTILHNLTWEIRRGQNWAIVGPNGVGKSLLMQVVQGHLPCSAGRVVYGDGLSASQVAQVSFELHHRLIAYEQDQEFFRQFSGDEGTTVEQLLRGGSPAAADGQAGEGSKSLIDIVRGLDLGPLLDAPLVTLSNGEMRKVLIARALQKAPRILILDEPYDGLDVDSRRRLAEVVDNLARLGIQILLVTHRIEEISESITHVLCLKDGTIGLMGDKKQVLEAGLVLYLSGISSETSAEKVEGADLTGRFAGKPVRSHNPELRMPLGVSQEPTVVMKDVTVVYGSKVVLDRLNWTVNRDENWAIVGPNGAGKTTLLRLISADHLQAYANEIYLFGMRRGSGESIWDIKRKIGVLSPEFQIGYREALPASDVVLSGFFDSVGLYRRPTADQRAQVRYWIEVLGAEDLAEQDFTRLSYGQRRIILLARALVKSPQMLLLDEPCQGLDYENRQRLIDTVSAVAQKTGTQILYVTHRRNEFPACISHILEFRRSSTDQASHSRYETEIHLNSGR